MLDVALQEEPGWPEGDWQALTEQAVRAAIEQSGLGHLLTAPRMVEVSLRLTDDPEVQALNARWRGKDRPTNVLSFPGTSGPEELTADAPGELLLGDIVLARETCLAEAQDKGIEFTRHAAHLIVHGTLHLLGHDHGEDDAAAAMEALESKALASLGLPDPYEAA